MATPQQQSGTAVAGYFATGHAAHRAINALIDAGFTPAEIGAAFHVRTIGGTQGSGSETGHAAGGSSAQGRSMSTGSSSSGDTGALETISDIDDDESTGTGIGGGRQIGATTSLPDENSLRSRTGSSGAASDTTAVQFGALGPGSGTPFDGAGRPGPITGSSLVNTGLPSELKSELPHDPASPSSSLGSASSTASTGTDFSQSKQGEESWSGRLDDIFGTTYTGTTRTGTTRKATEKDTAQYENAPKAPVTKESQDFGTGEGHLMLTSPPRQRYSQPAFERSFSSSGVQPRHAKHLSHRLGHGGAIVTVHSANRSGDAERILQEHGGQLSFDDSADNFDTFNDEREVEVFGTVHRDYPGFFD